MTNIDTIMPGTVVTTDVGTYLLLEFATVTRVTRRNLAVSAPLGTVFRSDLHQIIEVHEPTEEERALIRKHYSGGGLLQGLTTSVTSGTDPEFWFADSQDQMVPAFKVLPAKSPDTTVFWDGFQGEFVTNSHYCLQELAGDIIKQLGAIYNYADNQNLHVTLQSTYKLQDHHLQEDPKFLKLGCSPSLNIYGTTSNLGVDPEFIPVRFAGCHMHFGFNRFQSTLMIPSVVRQLDRICGVALCALFGHLEDPSRRYYYGLAGEHRIPAYGIEYRVPGPQVLCHPAIYMLSFELGRMAVRSALNGLGPILWDCTDEEAIEAINTSNQTLARAILKRNEPVLRDWLLTRFGAAPEALRTLYRGIEYKIADPTNIRANWHLGGGLPYTNHIFSWGRAEGTRGKI